MRFISMIILSILSTAAIANTALDAQIASSLVLDYLVSDVCVNAQDEVVQGDPAYCQNRRNIKVGEAIPYLVTDFDRSNGYATYQAMASLPVQGVDGSLKVMAVKSLQRNFNSDFKFSYDVKRDGYDLIDVTNSGYASFIRTSDPGCYDQLWSHNGGRSSTDRAGGWLLFPLSSGQSVPGNGQSFNATYNQPLSSNRPSGCKGGSSNGITFWNSPATYTFETGKQLTAIRSDHFASTKLDNSNNALERYYFTREYGFTRWEAWIPRNRCYSEGRWYCNDPDLYLGGRCSVMKTTSTGSPNVDNWGGQTWVRVDCRDQTNYIPLKQPQVLLNRSMAQSNGVKDIDVSMMSNLPFAKIKKIPAQTFLYAGQRLSVGNITLIMQADGNLVVYGPSGALWATSWAPEMNGAGFGGYSQGLSCATCVAVFQGDGNLVLYNPNFHGNPYQAYWASNTGGGVGSQFYLSTSKPYVRIKDQNGRSVWTSDTIGTWRANGPGMSHRSGSANGTAWEIAANGAYQNLTFGPYVSGVRPGRKMAVFQLLVDNNSADNNPVVDIDVFSLTTNRIYARATVTRGQFSAPWRIQEFILPFDYDGQGALEFRVHVHGHSYVLHAGTRLEAL